MFSLITEGWEECLIFDIYLCHFCVEAQKILLHVKLSGPCPFTMAISISLAWVSTITHPREGNGCDKKDSVKQLMSLSIIALVPIYRANKSKSLQMKHTGLLTHVCSQVTGYETTLVSKVTLPDNLPKTQLGDCFLIIQNTTFVKKKIHLLVSHMF